MMRKMSRAERHLINIVDESLFNHSDKISVASLISSEKMQVYLQDELLNNPELFFVSSFKIIYSSLSTVIYPSYFYDKSTCILLLEACRNKARQLISKIQGADDYTKTLQAHDLLARNVNYVNSSDRTLHTIVSPLTKKQGVCDGFARTLKYLLNMMDIPCLLVPGLGYDPGAGTVESHAWNMVQLDGNWTHIDVTYDTTIRSGQVLRYDYFGLTNEQILRDHEYEVDQYPIASKSDYGYYKRNNLVMDTRQQMKDYISSALSLGKMDCVFKIPDTSAGANLEMKVSSEIERLLEQLTISLRYTMSFNLSQRVFHISFKR